MAAIPDRPLRSGYTTGACATAATVGALQALLTQEAPQAVDIRLPLGQTVRFALKTCCFSKDEGTASVIKDAGDDPDVTQGAEIVTSVRLRPAPGIIFKAGEGIGTVTKPGLPIPPGEPSINPVPRRMMSEHGLALLKQFGCADQGIEITVSCPTGVEMARKTLNSRLGILGGLSILGTTGIVRPFSAAAYIASIQRGIDVAQAAGQTELVVTLGGKSEQFAMRLFPDKPEVCFQQMGNFFGGLLKYAVKVKVRRLVFVGMIGKWTKIASGHLDLHSARTRMDPNLFWTIAASSEIGAEWKEKIMNVNTAQEMSELAVREKWTSFHSRLCALCQDRAQQTIQGLKGTVETEFILIDYDGDVLGRSASAC